MKKSLKKAALIAAAGAMLIGSALPAQAASLYDGQWCVEDNGYWFKLNPEGSVFLANTWYWIKDSDGVIRCYYFDQNGWLVTNQTVGEYTLNDQGQWVVDGVVQTKSDAETDFATHTVLEAKTTTTAAAAAPTATATTTGKKSGKYYKSSGAGDNPANATFTQAYENSSIAGGTVTNNWANFTMTFSGVNPISENSGSGTDFYVDEDGVSNIYVSYFPIDKYAAGNTDLNSFVNGYLGDARGFRGGSRAGDTTFGPYSFVTLTKNMTTPDSTYTDHTYIRQVEGTNYAMVISVEQNGNSEDFVSSLNTMAKVR